VEWNKIANIVRSQIVDNKNPAEAVRQCGDVLKDAACVEDNGRAHFSQHLRMYVDIYMPDCRFEITTTNRYNNTRESAISARYYIDGGREIEYLVGTQVVIDEEQEKSLASNGNDFSLVVSSRRNTCSLLLGPARFANHDCDPNAKLDAKCYDKIRIIAVKPINVGDEITVSYGTAYFGESNKDCRCHTCERLGRNGWGMKKFEHSDPTDASLSQRTTRSMSRAQVSKQAAAMSSNAAEQDVKTISDAGICNRHLKLYRFS
jgi:histone-lysine N-methyltransferase SUV420H